MFDSFNYVKHYLPIRKVYWNGENLGVLLYEGYMGVELSHQAILCYFISLVNRKTEVPPQILSYVAKTIALGLEQKISSEEVLRGKGNKAKRKTTLPIHISECVAFLKDKAVDLKYFYEELSDQPALVGHTSSDNIQRVHQQEKKRCRRLLEVRRLLDGIVAINLELDKPGDITLSRHKGILDKHDKLKEIYKTPNKLW